MGHAPVRSNFERNLSLTWSYRLGYRNCAWQEDAQRVAWHARGMEAIREASEPGLRTKPLIDPFVGVIHVAGKKDGDGICRTEVQI